MNATILDSLMSPVTECLDIASLRALSNLRASTDAEQRIAWLAERAEYESCVMFANFLGVLQSKARRKLNAAD